MGYFNFYFIKKLIYNKKFRHFLFIVACVLFFLFIWNNVVNASYDFTLNGNDYSIPDIPYTPSNITPYGIVVARLYGSNITVQAVYSSFPLICYKESNNYKLGGGSNGTSGTASSYYYYNGRWTTQYVNSSQTYYNVLAEFQNSSLGNLQNSIIETNYLITYNDYVVASPPESYDVLPYFLNSDEDIAIGNQDLVIMPGDFSNEKDISFTIQEKTETDDGQGGVIESWHNLFTPLTLNVNSPYYEGIDGTGVGFYYVIPWSFISQYLQISKQYNYVLAYDIQGVRQTDDLYVTYGGLTPEDALKNSLDRQTNIMNQQLNQFIEFNNQLADVITGQQDTTSAINDLNDNITDSSITSGASDLH